MDSKIIKKKIKKIGPIRLMLSASILLLTSIIYTFFATGQLKAEEVISPSMEPTIAVGDRLIIKTIDQEEEPIKKGDIIVFEPQEEYELPLIKRVAALPGDVVFVRNQTAFINEQPTLKELRDMGIWPIKIAYYLEIGEDEVYVLGDNKENSYDSRYYGAVSKDRIIGKALFTYYPFDSAQWLETENDNSVKKSNK